MPAFVRFVTGMGAYMLLEMRQLREFALAYFATVWFDAQMDASVLRQITGIGKCFGALRAFVWFSFTHMNLGVQLKIGFRAKYL